MRRASLLAWIPLVALCTGAGVWWQAEGTRWKPPSPAPEAPVEGVRVRVEWTHSAPHARCIALDPSAQLVGIALPGSQIRVLDAGGQVLTQRQFRGADRVAVSGPGRVIAVHQHQAPEETSVTFVRPDGTVLWRHDAGAPIVDVALAAQGLRAACITASGHICAFDLDGQPRYRRWRSVSMPRQVYVNPSGSLIVVTTQDPPGVWGYTPDGRFVWKAPAGAATGSSQVYPGPDGRFLACVTQPQPTGRDPYASGFVVVTERGRQQWGARLRATSPVVALSADGHFAAITYTKMAALHGRTAYERKVALFETAASATDVPEQLWQHGGPFYDPRLVALAADGSFVATRDGGRALYFFGLSGQLLWRHKMPAPIVSAQASADGRSLLVYCSDGVLSLLRVEGPGG